MADYLKYVILIIDKEGNEYNVPVDETYCKHIQPFKKLHKQNSELKIDSYLNYRYTDNITGYEIASYLGAQGNIVFLHTDVSNWKMGKKEGTIIIPEKLTEKQENKLYYLIENLKRQDFSFYITQTKFKKKNSYKLIHQALKIATVQQKNYNCDERVESRNVK